LPFLPLIP